MSNIYLFALHLKTLFIYCVTMLLKLDGHVLLPVSFQSTVRANKKCVLSSTVLLNCTSTKTLISFCSQQLLHSNN